MEVQKGPFQEESSLSTGVFAIPCLLVGGYVMSMCILGMLTALESLQKVLTAWQGLNLWRTAIICTTALATAISLMHIVQVIFSASDLDRPQHNPQIT